MNQQQVQSPMRKYLQASLSGGINSSVPAELIGENEAQDILNFEYNEDDHLRTRSGVASWISTALPARITSLHYYENDASTIKVIGTAGTKVYHAPNTYPTSSWTDGTGSLTLPSDNFWMWKNWQGYAIGVNRATSGDNPIRYNGTNFAALGGSPPKAKYIEIWNERCWLVSATAPNTIYGSALGNPEDWTVDNASGAVVLDVGKNDGDRITGIYAFRGQLFVFKRTKIYVIKALEGTIPTDVGNLYVDLYSPNIGCISAYSIQAVLDDVLFLSDSGIASLVAAPLGELKTVLISQKVAEIKKIRKISQEIFSHYIEHASQYWLMVPETLSPRGIDEIYVLDVRRIQEGIIRWLRFDGKIAGTVATNIYVNGERYVLVAGTDKKVYSYIPSNESSRAIYGEGRFGISLYGDISNSTNFSDAGDSYVKTILSRAFDFGLIYDRKLFHRFGFNVNLLSQELDLNTYYYFDKNLGRITRFGFELDQETFNTHYGSAVFGSAVFGGASGRISEFSIIRQFKRNARGRKYINVTFKIQNQELQGFVFKDLLIQFAPCSMNRVNDIEVIQ